MKLGAPNCLISQLTPGDIIIIAHATFHKGEAIKQLIEEARCEIYYLPAYSPDLKKIENWWAVLKIWIETAIKGIRDGERLCRCCVPNLS